MNTNNIRSISDAVQFSSDSVCRVMESEHENDATCEVENNEETPVDVSSSESEVHEGCDGASDCDVCSAPYSGYVRGESAESKRSIFQGHSGAEGLIHSYNIHLSEPSSGNIIASHARTRNNREGTIQVEPLVRGGVAIREDAGSCSATMPPASADAALLAYAQNRHVTEMLGLTGRQPCNLEYGRLCSGVHTTLAPIFASGLSGGALNAGFSPRLGLSVAESEVAVQVEEVLNDPGDSDYSHDGSEDSALEESREDVTSSHRVREANVLTEVIGSQANCNNMDRREVALDKCLEEKIRSVKMHAETDGMQSAESFRNSGEDTQAKQETARPKMPTEGVATGGAVSSVQNNKGLLGGSSPMELQHFDNKVRNQTEESSMSAAGAVDNEEDTFEEAYDATDEEYQDDEEEDDENEIVEEEDDGSTDGNDVEEDEEAEDQQEENEQEENEQEEDHQEEDQQEEEHEEYSEDEAECTRMFEGKAKHEVEHLPTVPALGDGLGSVQDIKNAVNSRLRESLVDVVDGDDDMRSYMMNYDSFSLRSETAHQKSTGLAGDESQVKITVPSFSHGIDNTALHETPTTATQAVACQGDASQPKRFSRLSGRAAAVCGEPSLPPADTPAVGVTPTVCEYKKQLLTLSRSAWGSSGLAQLQSALTEEKSSWDLENLRTGGLQHLLQYKSPFAPERQRQKRRTIRASLPDAKRVEYFDKRTLAVSYKSTLESDRILAKNLGGWDSLFALRGQLASIDRDLLEEMVLELCCLEPRVISKIAECCVRTTNRTVLVPR